MTKKKNQKKDNTETVADEDVTQTQAESAQQQQAEETTEPQAVELDPIEKLQAEKDELFDRLQRVTADFQNAMKRNSQQLPEQINYAKGDLLKTFIPALDHFDNALANEPKTDEAIALRDGMQIVRDELLKVLTQAGVKKIDVEVGQLFDPYLHEAMMQQAVDGVEPGQVSIVMQTGYLYQTRTLRPAKVAVAPAPLPGAPPEAEDQEAPPEVPPEAEDAES